MKLNKKICVTAFAVMLGSMINLCAFADETAGCDCKYGIINVQEVLNNSAQVKALKKEQEQTAQELIKYMENARKEIASVSDEEKKKLVEKKYINDLASKRDKLEKEYVQKLKAIDDSITSTINEYAKTNGYKMIISKDVVLYGGEDITEAVKKIVK